MNNEIIAYGELEASVLAFLIQTGEANEKTADAIQKLTENDFHLNRNKIVFKYIKKLAQEGSSFDIINIDSEIGFNKHDYDLMDGFGYLAELADKYTPHDTQKAVDKLKNARKLRELSALMNESHELIYGNGSELERLSAVQSRLSDFSFIDDEKEIFKKTFDMAVRFVDRLQTKMEKGNGLAGLSTGYNILDKLTGGFEAGDYIGICGKPSSGKTAMMMNIMIKAARRGESVVFFSAEMAEAPVVDRIFSMMARVELQKIRSGNFTIGGVDTQNLDFARISEAAREFKSLPITMIDMSGMSISDIEMQLKVYSIKNGNPDWVFVDYWQILRAEGYNQVNELENGSARLKQAAKRFSTRLCVGAQLRKDSIGDPKPAHIKGSAKLEEDTDILLFVHSDNEDYKPVAGQLTQIIAAKVRNGEIGTMCVKPEMQFQTFQETDEEYVKPQKPMKSKKFAKGEL